MGLEEDCFRVFLKAQWYSSHYTILPFFFFFFLQNEIRAPLLCIQVQGTSWQEEHHATLTLPLRTEGNLCLLPCLSPQSRKVLCTEAGAEVTA